MYECFHCGMRSVIWGADFNAEEYGFVEPGIVHSLHCENCGAEITYYIPLSGEENENGQQQTGSEEGNTVSPEDGEG